MEIAPSQIWANIVPLCNGNWKPPLEKTDPFHSRQYLLIL
tara:strand:- start:65 stop:184 length:120 start_codon:yes stop_codon:yes gene_type:complete